MKVSLPENQVRVIKQLRDETGSAMMDCKKALVSCNWDYDKAKEELKSWGRSGLIDRRLFNRTE